MCEPASSVLRKVDVRGVLTQDDVSVMQKFQHTTQHLQQRQMMSWRITEWNNVTV